MLISFNEEVGETKLHLLILVLACLFIYYRGIISNMEWLMGPGGSFPSPKLTLDSPLDCGFQLSCCHELTRGNTLTMVFDFLDVFSCSLAFLPRYQSFTFSNFNNLEVLERKLPELEEAKICKKTQGKIEI